ncbi:NAD(P)/FAD-dependent oxidoreductase [Nocardia jinanensis]|uniref:Pyridine nucleotide-disulfide oxidoreductase n=1 Tax=Nocardia jinanensis TaxID=382504 RepID=A0A917VS81_9NOCA|nr:FAD-dependent oxidoreductase [Nocardia jinanensis]GGL13470.1 pyridine nucleotide-disulfide oxidoreductase [Nocardia jinanensis]
MSEIPGHILVVGAGLGGLRTIEALRSAGYSGLITLIGAEPELPYDRPPLSKQVLSGTWEPARTQLAGYERLRELHVDADLGNPVVELRGTRAILANGHSVDAGAVVIATGVRARRLPGQTDAFHTLRTLDDALALRSRLAHADNVLVLGSGFIGNEVASTAVEQGKTVTVVEAAPHPLARSFGPAVGGMTARLLTDAGVTLLCDTTVEEFLDPDSGVAVRLATGDELRAELGVVGVGGIPDLDWLADDRVIVANGVHCTERGSVVGTDNIWAVGDAAAWYDPACGEHIRTEHWTSAQDQAKIVAAAILGVSVPTMPTPYVWSDQFGMKIQVLGRVAPDDDIVQLHGEGFGGGAIRGTVLGHFADDRLTAVTGFGAPAIVARYRAAIVGVFDRAQVEAFATGLAAKRVPAGA